MKPSAQQRSVASHISGARPWALRTACCQLPIQGACKRTGAARVSRRHGVVPSVLAENSPRVFEGAAGKLAMPVTAILSSVGHFEAHLHSSITISRRFEHMCSDRTMEISDGGFLPPLLLRLRGGEEDAGDSLKDSTRAKAERYSGRRARRLSRQTPESGHVQWAGH